VKASQPLKLVIRIKKKFCQLSFCAEVKKEGIERTDIALRDMKVQVTFREAH
jgi:hypothetical protein